MNEHFVFLECGECGGHYLHAGPFAKCEQCGHEVAREDFDMDEGETLTVQDAYVGYITEEKWRS